MTQPHSNGAGPEPSPPHRNEEQEAAAQQARVEALLQLVDQRIEERLRQLQPQQGGGASSSGAGVIVAQVITRAPEICTAIVSALNAFTQAKVMANPLGHLEIIAQTNPRLLALYSPNPLSDQFTNIFATAFAQGMRVASSGKAGALGPLVPAAPTTPATPAPSSAPTGGPSASPSPASGPTGSPGSTPASGGGSSTVMSDEVYAGMLSAVQAEYQRRHSVAS